MTAADDARDEIIAALDARTTRQGDQLAGLEISVSESADLLAQVLPRLDSLGTDVSELSGRVGAGATGGGGKSDSPVLGVRWELLTADEAAAAWNELGEWVATVLGPEYEISRAQLPDCWALHRPVVRRLSALHTAYLAAYTGHAASAAAAADWHDRWLPHALGSIATEGVIRFRADTEGPWFGVCAPGRHLAADVNGTLKLNDRGVFISYPEKRDPQQYEPPGQKVEVAYDPIHHSHWGPFFQRAVAEDVAARRAREWPAQ